MTPARDSMMPGRHLLAAVVHQAVQDAAGRDSSRTSETEREDARAWVESESERPFSFRWYCDLLDLDPDYLRREILHPTRDVPRRHKSRVV